MYKIKKATTGLIFAMQEEQQGLHLHIQNKSISNIGHRQFIEGELFGHRVVSVLSGIGKVAAAITCTQLIERFGITDLILTGVAGAADPHIHRGDIVIANELLQHDMDASPLFPKFEIPLKNKSRFQTNHQLTKQLSIAAEQYLKTKKHDALLAHLHIGLIGSGDQFICDQKLLIQLKTQLSDLLAVEMEGAAVAQVCDDYDLPFAIVRTISDSADEDASVDFQEFIGTVAAPFSIGVLKEYFEHKQRL